MISTVRSVTRHARRFPAQQRRRFALGGSSGPPPEWEGVDKVVRGHFPQDYQRALPIWLFCLLLSHEVFYSCYCYPVWIWRSLCSLQNLQSLLE